MIMKKIALIYMGGTFGCIGEPLSPMPEAQFIPQLKKILPLAVSIDCFSAPSVKDSSACSAADWLLLIQYIQNLQLQHYQHFVIIHGTDTLSYAAATLARFLQQSCHVMVTGSQYPLLNVQGNQTRDFSDALDNLNTSLQWVLKVPSGVYVAFHHRIIHASTAHKVHTMALDAFHGITHETDLSASEHAQFIVLNQHIEHIKKLNIITWMMQPIEINLFSRNLENLKHQLPDFLILQGYGTGNIAVDAVIIEQLQQIQSQGCVVILDTQVALGGLDQRYAISQWVTQAKIIVNDTRSHADLYAKILKMYLQYSTSDQWHDHWYEQ